MGDLADVITLQSGSTIAYRDFLGRWAAFWPDGMPLRGPVDGSEIERMRLFLTSDAAIRAMNDAERDRQANG